MSIALLSLKIHYVPIFSQTTDTICLPVAKAKALVIAAEQGKNAIEKIKVYESQISVLNERIDGFNKIIATYREKEGNYNKIIETLEDQKKIYLQEKTLYENRIVSLEKEVAKNKKAKKRLSVLGLIGTIGGFVLGVSLGH